jgi:hypothetical protein
MWSCRYLLKVGLRGFKGCAFIGEDDSVKVIVRGRDRALPLSQCGVPVDRRFTFYDQVHTTGMDIRQAVDANAVVTVGVLAALLHFVVVDTVRAVDGV